jgi:hypothetical protein
MISEAEAKAILDNIAIEMEDKLQQFASFKLVRINDMLYSERVDIELAEEEHEMAKSKPKEYKFEIHHPIDSKLRAKIDYSRGQAKPELELVHRKDAGVDRDTINKEFNGLFDGTISLLDIPEMKEVLGNIAQLQQKQAELNLKTDEKLEKYAKNVDVHVEWLYNELQKFDAKLSSPSPAPEPRAPLEPGAQGAPGQGARGKGLIRRVWEKIW